MKLDIIKESLKPSTAYMLRNDGKLFELNGIHPYVLSTFDDYDIEENIDLLFSSLKDLQWFYDNIDDLSFKDDVSKFLYVVYYNPEYFGDYKSKIERFNMPLIEYYCSKEECEALIQKIDAESNQQFCRVRTSDMFIGGNNKSIYFRISSVRFNWFNIIWDLVYNNRNFISDVTISRDGTEDLFYEHNGHIIENMPVEEFINLSGKPVFENLNKFFKAKSLHESIGTMNTIRFMRRITFY